MPEPAWLHSRRRGCARLSTLPLYRDRADVDRRAGGFKAGIDQNAATDRRLPD
jgi:hypothetical protein